MNYSIIFEHANGTTTTTTRHGDNVKQVYDTTTPPTGAKIKAVYPTTTHDDGTPDPNAIIDGATIILRRTTANIVRREGTPDQWRLYNHARHDPYDDPDTADIMNVAILAIIQAIHDGESIYNQYHSAYKAVNNYLYSIRAIRSDERPMHIYYDDPDTGDIMNVNKGLATLLKSGDRYNPTPDDDPDPDDDTGEKIARIMGALTPIQKKVARCIAYGYSERATAEKLKRSKTTIHEHIENIRKTGNRLYPDLK